MVLLEVARDNAARRQNPQRDRRISVSSSPLPDTENAGRRVCATQGPLAARSHARRRLLAAW